MVVVMGNSHNLLYASIASPEMGHIAVSCQGNHLRVCSELISQSYILCAREW